MNQGSCGDSNCLLSSLSTAELKNNYSDYLPCNEKMGETISTSTPSSDESSTATTDPIIKEGSLVNNPVLFQSFAEDTLKRLTIFGFKDEEESDKVITFYEIGYEGSTNCIIKKRYSEFRKFYEDVQLKAIEYDISEVLEYNFPNKSIFHTSSEFTKERRLRGFISLFKLAVKYQVLHTLLLDYLCLDYILNDEEDGKLMILHYGSELSHISTDLVPNQTSKHQSQYDHNVTLSANKVLKRVRQGYTTAIGGSFLTAEAAIQGMYLSSAYVPIKVPDGPTSGREIYAENYLRILDSAKFKTDLFYRIHQSFFSADHFSSDASEDDVMSVRKLRLMLVGDSLVCGVGCDNDIGPVMPRIIAQVLSLMYRAQVNWFSRGINGGSAEQIRSLIPQIAEELDTNPLEESEELLLVIMCGLNDWKTLVTNFPYGSGPLKFKKALKCLLDDVASKLGTKLRVFFPAVPIGCVATDPKASLQIRPLKYFVDFVSHTWDFQKKDLATENYGGFSQLVFIPTASRYNLPYSTPGEGNTCSDGVHPSTQGYEWFALHISDYIKKTLR